MHYELLGCALHGHFLVGTDAAEIRPRDVPLVRECGAVRWHRCLRCDVWVPLPPPSAPSRPHPPEPEEITPPLRGRPLRDRYVLRLIAVDRFLHVVVLTALAVAILVLMTHQARWQAEFARFAADLQTGLTGPVPPASHGVLGQVQRLLAVRPERLQTLLAVVVGYAVLESVEMVGLWFARRWAEYLTFVATTLLLVPEVYELSHRVTVLKLVTLVVNVAIVVYLLVAKRLFGVRGGGRAEQAERDADSGWPAIERATPA